MAKTKRWCDVASLSPPDGKFMERMKTAIQSINTTAVEQRGPPIIIRIMFGNIIGMPVNCHALIRELVSGIRKDTCNIQLWVGAWRRGVSWNHAKIIAVDGVHLFQGGHNLWDAHYLQKNPVHDLSMQAAGRCARDGHIYLDKQWSFIQKMQSNCVGWFVDKLPDWLPTPLQTRVTVSEFPEGRTAVFPPGYAKRRSRGPHDVRMITMGRYGSIQGVGRPRLHKARPSDDAFVAMFKASKKSIRMALQDLGPPCVPGTLRVGLDKMALPGTVWPAVYLNAIGQALMKGVQVEIALSTPGSIPNDLSMTEALYGNGWECNDVAAEIIKEIIKMGPHDVDVEQQVKNNLRICYIKQGGKNTWRDGKGMGMHAKHFIIDDIAYYIGSQNLYICDLAEWGILVDDEQQTKRVKAEYWTPMWEASYIEAPDRDWNIEAAMDGSRKSRNGGCWSCLPMADRRDAIRKAAGCQGNSNFRTAH
ncbi:unnamed protein product [Prorocentrum cordatum]|uniref:PLD phosphodiesterase domain-containing protein n=1 Tax=Prorocentrum cordatum TaxID=2364126 RepID=A0ABN9UXB2_9DINO|nr:unnamed protein product [Polarella glacialis]